MTVSESVIQWLKRFGIEGLEKIKDIDTDALKATVASYGLMKAPQENVKCYMSGKKIHTDYYQFSARLDSGTDTDRTDNQAWLDALAEWIAERNREKDFPVLREGLTCTGISVTSPFYMGKSDSMSAIYQLTIAIRYEKE